MTPLSTRFQLADCLFEIFSYHIQFISNDSTHYSKSELSFLRKFILCWDFTSNVNVKDFLRRTRGSKLQYVKARGNASLDDECFKYFRGIQHLDVAMSASQASPFTNAALENLGGILSLNLSWNSKHLRMGGCHFIGDSAFDYLRAVKVSIHVDEHIINEETAPNLRNARELYMCGGDIDDESLFDNLRKLERLHIEDVGFGPTIIDEVSCPAREFDCLSMIVT